MSKEKSDHSSTIALNRKARHEYYIEENYEAGIMLEGWEVKSMRAGRVQIAESYVVMKGGEAYLFGSHITPLLSASTHVNPDPTRTRKLLLNAAEIGKIRKAVERTGYTAVPLALYWKKGWAKLDIGIAKGKQTHDKRATEKDRTWERDKQRILRRG